MDDTLKNYLSKQVTFYQTARNLLDDFKSTLPKNKNNTTLASHFSQIDNGTVITSDYDIFPAIVDAAKKNPDSAALIYMSARSDAKRIVGTFYNQFDHHIPANAIVDLVLLQSRSKGTKDWLLPQRKELTALKDECQAGLNEIRSRFDEQSQAIDEQRQFAKQAHKNREDQWDILQGGIASDWSSLKKIYDEQLALLAPTQYWSERAENHQCAAICFALAFGIALIASMIAFACLAMPYMSGLATNKEASLVLTLVPVAVPAFAGFWVLRILSRLLSENLQMMRDARERETMVKTFLALMRDDKSGKSIVNDNDRILILHSLFRPSSVTAVDDAPPVHWFDILTNKVGLNKSKK